MKTIFFVLSLVWVTHFSYGQAKIWNLGFVPPASGDSIKLDINIYFSPGPDYCTDIQGFVKEYRNDTLVIHGYYIELGIASGFGCFERDTLYLGKWSDNINVNVVRILPYLIDTFANPDDTTSYPPGGYILRSLDVKDNTIAKDDIRVFPNPTSHMLFIKTVREIRSIIVQDVVGKTIYTYRGKKDEIDLSAMPKGVYILQLETDEGIITKKIAKE